MFPPICRALFLSALVTSVLVVLTAVTGLVVTATLASCHLSSDLYLESNRDIFTSYVFQMFSRVPGVTGAFLASLMAAALWYVTPVVHGIVFEL